MPLAALTIAGVGETNQNIIALLNENGIDTVVVPRDLPEAERFALLAPCDAILAGMEPYNEEVLQKLPNLKLISRQGGGIDSIDLAACKRHGVQVQTAKGSYSMQVAELIMAMMLHFARGIIPMNESMHNHEWKRLPTHGLLGKRIGLIGFGSIGKEVAKMAAAFSMNISYYSHFRDEHDTNYRATFTPLPRLFSKNDYIVITCPLTEETYHMIGEEELRQMGPKTILINAARGPVVDEHALANALKEGIIRGAGVDVYENEPAVDSPLIDCPNTILTPHVGSFTYRGVLEMGKAAAWNIIDFFA